MNKDELIKKLKSDLSNMINWASNLNDEYLDSDPETRKQFVKDIDNAYESLKINLAAECKKDSG